MDIWKTIETERLQLADELVDLTPEQWSADTCCDGWTVRHVVDESPNTNCPSPLATNPADTRLATNNLKAES